MGDGLGRRPCVTALCNGLGRRPWVGPREPLRRSLKAGWTLLARPSCSCSALICRSELQGAASCSAGDLETYRRLSGALEMFRSFGIAVPRGSKRPGERGLRGVIRGESTASSIYRSGLASSKRVYSYTQSLYWVFLKVPTKQRWAPALVLPVQSHPHQVQTRAGPTRTCCVNCHESTDTQLMPPSVMVV